MYLHLILLFLIIVWMILRYKEMKNTEFIFMFLILMLELYHLHKINYTEFFDDNFTFDKFYDIPKYMENSIGSAIDNLIKSSQPKTANNNDVNNQAFISPELFLNDSSVLSKDGNIDNDKYNILIHEYLCLDSILNLMSNQFTNYYNVIVHS